jgi:gamma-glutamylcyclotransferase (GGCT)/AIG2-like uncharacterized protein YtfP
MAVKCGRHPADCEDNKCPTHGVSHILYVYGTLRPGKAETVEIPGKLYDLGWYPGARIAWDGKDCESKITCERIEVADWGPVDAYEGYNPKFPDDSLYIRRPYLDGFIYEYNRELNEKRVVNSGDWLNYTQTERGRNHGYGG